ncbi:MAG TPA: flagellar biosynthesis anti-sigma factor FlgM [Thermodesulfobacteriota bacterium]|nr:flagellar biosynthesis anti-sigma factor FlgM [Thermodesulfobacteriota bacterium]
MKIQDMNNDGQSIRQITQGMKPPQSEKNPPASSVTSPDAGSDRVELSPQSRDMKKIHEILATTPEMRTEKVAELKKAIADGSYRVNTEDIADKMLKEMVFESNR